LETFDREPKPPGSKRHSGQVIPGVSVAMISIEGLPVSRFGRGQVAHFHQSTRFPQAAA